VLVDEVVLSADRAILDECAKKRLRLRNNHRLVSAAHTRCAIASARARPPRSALTPRVASRADKPKARAQRCTFAFPCALGTYTRSPRAPPRGRAAAARVRALVSRRDRYSSTLLFADAQMARPPT
jgi:hypothetical protein